MSAHKTFNAELYVRAYPDVLLTGMDPKQHYEKYGRMLGRDPAPDDVYPSVSNGGGNAAAEETPAIQNGQNALKDLLSGNAGGAIDYWSKQLYDSPAQLKWFVATSIRTKSAQARDILVHAATRGSISRFSDFEILLERLRIHRLTNKQLKDFKAHFWRSGVRALARLLYTQRLNPSDVTNARFLYGVVLAIWGDGYFEGVDWSYYADLLVDHREYRLARKLLKDHQSENAQRSVSQRFLQLNSTNPFLPEASGSAEAWLDELNAIYAKRGFAPIYLAAGEERPFYRLRCDAEPLKGELPLISVIMPIYEPDASTDLAIQSLLNQTWHNIEIIAVDDCSPEVDREGNPSDYRERLGAWQGRDPRVRVIFNPENRGAYFARNTGYELAKGKYVTIADKDDWHHPQKLELQAKQLESEPDRFVNITNWVRVNEDLRFLVRWGPDRVVCPSFASMLYRREQLRETFGYWDEVRKSADGEMKFRVQAYFGIDIQPEEPLPMALSLMGENNLTSEDLGLGFEDDNRRAYHLGYKGWHAAIKKQEASPYLDRGAPARKFPAPNKFLPHKPDYEEFDVVVLSEFGFEAGNTTSLRNEIRVALGAGLKVAVMPCFNFLIQAASLRHMTPAIQAMIDSGQITRLPMGAVARAKLLIIRWPAIMQVVHGGISGLQVDKIVVVANHPPYEGLDNRVSYDASVVSNNVEKLFGKRPVWAPQSEQIHDMLKHMVPVAELDDIPWKGILPGPMPSVRVPDFSRKPVVGRHGRDQPPKWPSSREVLLAAYPIDGSVDVAFLGGAATPVRNGHVTEDEVAGWQVHGFNGIPVPAYLEKLDYFIYFHSDGWVEAFGMTIIEAMSHGCVCILQKSFESVFGDAALYCEPREIQSIVRRLWSNPDLYLAQQRKGRAFVDEYTSPDAYIRRLARYGVMSRPGEATIQVSPLSGNVLAEGSDEGEKNALELEVE